MADNFITSLGNTLRNGFCTVANTAQDFGIGLGVGAEYRGIEASVDIIRLVQRLTCNREPAPGYNPPFVGGQCPVAYSIVVDIYACVTSGCGTDPNYGIGTYTGPIAYVRGGFKPGSGWGAFVGTPSGEAFFLLTGAGPTAYVSFDTVNVRCTRVDGLPDNCGNPTPSLPPSEPGQRNYSTTFTYTDNSSDDHSLTFNATYGDIVFGINGDVTIPTRVTIGDTYGDTTFNASLNLSTGGVSFNLGNPNFNPTGNPTGDDYVSDDTPDYPPTIPNSIAPPSSNSPDTDTTGIIRAVIVTVTSNASNSTEIFQDDNPSIFAPNLGFVQFGCSVSGVVAWTEDIPIKNYRQLVPCPWDGGAIEVRGTPRSGVVWVLTPVYIQQERPVVFA